MQRRYQTDDDRSGRKQLASRRPIARREVELRLKDPGHEVDLLVFADLHASTQVWVGELTIREASRRGLVALQGPPLPVEAFPGWLNLGAFAENAGRAKPQHVSTALPSYAADQELPGVRPIHAISTSIEQAGVLRTVHATGECASPHATSARS